MGPSILVPDGHLTRHTTPFQNGIAQRPVRIARTLGWSQTSDTTTPQAMHKCDSHNFVPLDNMVF